MFEKYIDQLRPHAQRIGVRCESLAMRGLALLQQIEQNTREEGLHQSRQRLNFTLAAGVPVSLFNLRTADEAVVETIIADSAAGNVTITQNGQLRLALNFAGADTKTWGDAGPVIHGQDGMPTIVAAAPTNVYVQLQLRRPAPSHLTHHSGTPELQPDNVTDPRQEANMESRHGSYTGQRPNIIGERKGDGLATV